MLRRRRGRLIGGLRTSIVELSETGTTFIDIDIDDLFPNAKLVKIFFRATSLNGTDHHILFRLDQGSGVASSGYHWNTFGQDSVNGTPTTPNLDTSEEIAEDEMRITLQAIDVTDDDASVSGMIVIPYPRTTAAAKMVLYQTTHTNAGGTGSGVLTSTGGGSLHASNGAIDTVRLLLGNGGTSAIWSVTARQYT